MVKKKIILDTEVLNSVSANAPQAELSEMMENITSLDWMSE